MANKTQARAVVTLAIGEYYTRMGAVTHPLMEHYASRCRAEFVTIDKSVVEERYGLPPRYDKFQVYDLLDRFDQIAFFDTDVLVAPDAPSVFDIVRPDVFGASSEPGFTKSIEDKAQTAEILGPVEWRSPYFNSGMMVFGRVHKCVFSPMEPGLRAWALGDYRDVHGPDGADQAYLNHRINQLGIPFLDLGYRFNHTRCIVETETRFRSHVIHYSGPSGHRYGERLRQLEKDANVLWSDWRLWYSREFLWLRWLADRLDPAFLDYLVRERWGGVKTKA